MEFIQSILSHDVPVVLPSVVTHDLPVNPLSHIYLTIKCKRLGTATSHVPYFMNLPAILSRIEVLYKGSAVYSLSGVDCMASGILVNNFESWSVNAEDIEDAEWAITLLVPMTRKLYDPNECFPGTTRGELILQLTYADSCDDWDLIRMQIETVELPDASASQFIKQTTLSATPTSNVPLDIPLPIGNDISDIVVWQHQIQEGVSDMAAIDKMEILVDNINHFYPESFIETIQNMPGWRRAAPGYYGYHTHKQSAATFVEGAQVSAPKPEDHILACYMLLPFDVLRDGEYALKTAGASSVNLRLDVSAFGAIRVIPVEVVGSAGAV